jgi:hypothetical protein
VSCDPHVESAAPNLIDISKLPTSAAGLLKQLLASMADKDGPKMKHMPWQGQRLMQRMSWLS